MIKKLTSVVTLVLALNFLFVAGGVGFLVFTGKLDKDKVREIRTIITGPTSAPTAQAAAPTTQELPEETPMMRLEKLVSESAGRPAEEQIDSLQKAFESQTAVIERRAREVEDQRRQLEQAKAEYENQRKSLLKDQETLKSKQAVQTKADEDKGFQDTLALYQSMPAKRTKAIFMTLPDDTVVRYLQAMDSRQASGILKEFKTPEETSRAQAILEKMRQANAKAE